MVPQLVDGQGEIPLKLIDFNLKVINCMSLKLHDRSFNIGIHYRVQDSNEIRKF